MLLKSSELMSSKTPNGTRIKVKNGKKSFLLKNKKYYDELALLVEALKVEGWWNHVGRISISSKSPELINLFEYLLNFHNIETYKHVDIKVKIPKAWTERERIKVLKGNQELKFHYGRNGFTKELDRIVFWDRFESAGYKIVYDEEVLAFKTAVSKEKLATDLTQARIYGNVRANNKSFTTFLYSVLNEKTASSEIQVNQLLKNAAPSLVAKVFGILVDCEGSIRFSGFTRNIHIRMINRKYLEDWHELLKAIGVSSRVSPIAKVMTELVITCNQNFKKLCELGFALCHKKKKERFEKIMKSYQRHQFQRNSALDTYLNYVRKNPNTSALELSKKLNKDKRVVSHYLKRLTEKGQIKIQSIGQKYLYTAV